MKSAPYKKGDQVKVENDVNNGTYEISYVSCNGTGWDGLLKGILAIVPHTMLTLA